jgi:esterase/lipase superfamily enzyme
VVLAAPDSDIDVFRIQVAVVVSMTPLTILVSKDDRAYHPGRLSSGRERVGMINVTDPRVQDVDWRSDLGVINLSTMNASDAFNHDRFITFTTECASVVKVMGAMATRCVRRAPSYSTQPAQL